MAGQVTHFSGGPARLLFMSTTRIWDRLNTWVPPQPHTGILAAVLALAGLLGAWAGAPTDWAKLNWFETAFVLAFLVCLLVWAGTHPLHLRHQTKVHLTTLPIYLIALLVPPALAGVAAGLGVLIGQLRMRPQTGNYPSDMAIAVSRWVMVALCASALAHWPAAGAWPLAFRLGGTAALMFVLDVLTSPFELSPMSGEPPIKVIYAVVHDGGLYESAQYLIAILAAAAAIEQTWTLVLLVVPIYLIYSAFRNAKEVHDGTYRLLESLADAVDLRDPYTGGHSRRVAHWVTQIMKEVKVHGPEAELIKTAARMHDIGKIGVPDAILNKTGRLTLDEKTIMDSHPERGAELLARFADFANGQKIVLHHHESWDGSGYPDGLKSWDIPFGARVIAVADSYDAMTSDRPYRAAMSIAQASRILRDGRDQQWDPIIVEAFLRCIERMPAAELTTPAITMAATAATPR